MSKLKTPQEKKAASLDCDRRNAYGENDKASRKNIPRSRQLSHQAERRAANQPLSTIKGSIEEDEAVSSELRSRTQSALKRSTGFRKHPDAPLKDVLEHKRTGRWPNRYR